jgi:hypothetical protein
LTIFIKNLKAAIDADDKILLTNREGWIGWQTLL